MISLSSSVEEISINTEIDAFSSKFRECVDKGMIYNAFSLKLKDGQTKIGSKIKIDI